MVMKGFKILDGTHSAQKLEGFRRKLESDTLGWAERRESVLEFCVIDKCNNIHRMHNVTEYILLLF